MKPLRDLLIVSSLSLCLAGPAYAQSKAPPSAEAMQTHMKEMQEQMNRIRQAKDSRERERLMSEHMKSMSVGMAMMDGMRHGASGAGKGPSGDMRMEMMERQGMMPPGPGK